MVVYFSIRDRQTLNKEPCSWTGHQDILPKGVSQSISKRCLPVTSTSHLQVHAPVLTEALLISEGSSFKCLMLEMYVWWSLVVWKMVISNGSHILSLCARNDLPITNILRMPHLLFTLSGERGKSYLTKRCLTGQLKV